MSRLPRRVRASEGLSPQSVKHELGAIRAACRDAGSAGYKTPDALFSTAARNPWRIPKVAVKTRYLTQEEFLRVYQALEPNRCGGHDGPRRLTSC